MNRPRIGITTSLNDGEQRLDRRYTLAIERAGGLPVIVPMIESARLLRDVLDNLDGIVVPGGPAITTGLIGDLPAELPQTDPIRTTSDRLLLEVAIQSQKPVLGICYGMQLINSMHGGSIYGDVQNQLEGILPHSEKRGGADHPIGLTPGSLVSRLLEPGVHVNTRHLQAVAAVGHGLKPTAHAPDGVIEAIESDDGLILGVQFHPERMNEIGLPLFENLVRRAKSRI